MIPIRDENPTRRTPFVTVSFIILNCLVFFYQISLQHSLQEAFIYRFGAIPANILSSSSSIGTIPLHWLSLLTSMFMHGGLLHLGREYALSVDLRQ